MKKRARNLASPGNFNPLGDQVESIHWQRAAVAIVVLQEKRQDAGAMKPSDAVVAIVPPGTIVLVPSAEWLTSLKSNNVSL